MAFPSVLTADQAAGLIPDGATVTVSSSSGLGCPDAVLAAVGRRFDETGHPRRLTTLHPIAAGDMYGVKGIDHIAKEGLLAKVLAGSYPSGPSSAEPPAIWRMITGNAVPAYNIPSGILFDMHREAAAKRPGVITKIGLDTFVDPDREGCAMNGRAAAEPIVSRIAFADDTWLFFPTIVVDVVVVAPDQMQTTQTYYDPAISGEIFRPLSSFSVPEFGIQKVIARRVARELQYGDAVNIGFGISANVPRILLEEGRYRDVTWVIEQGAIGGVPLLDFQFGCAANAEAIMPAPHQFTYFQGGGFHASLLSFLEIDRQGSVNVSKLGFKPHVTAGAGGFVDITARARKIVFSGFFTAGAGLDICDGRLVI